MDAAGGFFHCVLILRQMDHLAPLALPLDRDRFNRQAFLIGVDQHEVRQLDVRMPEIAIFVGDRNHFFQRGQVFEPWGFVSGCFFHFFCLSLHLSISDLPEQDLTPEKGINPFWQRVFF